MENLDTQYQKRIDQIAKDVQSSEALSVYLDTEEFAEYKVLIDHFEPIIQVLYLEVASDNPLQLLALEKVLLTDELEGMYIPKIMGYSVLRGEVNDNFKYRKPEDHFKEVVEATTQSSNFEMIKLRVGQSIQIGFALSSDIWITNIIESINNTRVKYFLQSQKIEKYRTLRDRKIVALKYKKQFLTLNYYTAEFPTTVNELRSNYHALRTFLLYRGKHDYNNAGISSHLNEFIKNDALKGESEYLKLILIIGLFFDLDSAGTKAFAAAFTFMKKNNPKLEEQYFVTLAEMIDSEEIKITPEADKRLSQLINGKATDKINEYYTLMNTIHTKGFVNDDAIEAAQEYYGNHAGLSLNNKCLRAGLLNYFAHVMDNLEPEAYQEYFEINKTFVQYINIFDNQKFNQSVKSISLRYIKRLIKRFTDKRGRDYQDIKKFVRATFIDLNFMNTKELVEMFKTRRKKKEE
ncbi:MAG: hypothetical protein V3V14_12360 [Saprospiraceae bacterium]